MHVGCAPDRSGLAATGRPADCRARRVAAGGAVDTAAWMGGGAGRAQTPIVVSALAEAGRGAKTTCWRVWAVPA